MLVGYRALIIPLVWVVVFGIVAFSIWYDWKGERNRIRRWGAAFFFLGALLMSTKIVRQVWFQHELHSLRSTDITEIQIGGEQVALQSARDEVVSALNGSVFLDPRDGGPVRRPLYLEVRLRSGATRRYSIARYHEGTSITSGAKAAFSTNLASVLERAGKPLPNWQEH
jgi:hypothetical protein